MKVKEIADLDELARLLGTTVDQLIYLAHNINKNVLTSHKAKPGQSGRFRTITAPSNKLKAIQRLIKGVVLDDYKYPTYTYGLGGNTLKQHGRMHRGSNTTVQVDLRDFYPSIKHDAVYKMWSKRFGYPHDVARVLTKLTTMKGSLQQGFPTSSHIAAIAAEDFTREVSEYCTRRGLVFTQYIDDLNISGVNINQRLLFKAIIPIGRRHKFFIKKSKTKINAPDNGKEITGVSVYKGGTRAARRIRQRATRALKYYASTPKDELAKRRVAGYRGFIRHINKSDGTKYAALVEEAERS